MDFMHDLKLLHLCYCWEEDGSKLGSILCKSAVEIQRDSFTTESKKLVGGDWKQKNSGEEKEGSGQH